MALTKSWVDEEESLFLQNLTEERMLVSKARPLLKHNMRLT